MAATFAAGGALGARHVPAPLAASDWRERAECRDLPSAWFFPTGWDELSPDALAACRRCPVRAECRQEGKGAPDGLWGGELQGRKITNGHRVLAVMEPDRWYTSRELHELAGMHIDTVRSQVARLFERGHLYRRVSPHRVTNAPYEYLLPDRSPP